MKEAIVKRLGEKNLDAVVREGLWERFESLFRDFGWDVVILKYGALLESAFKEPGGDKLRRASLGGVKASGHVRVTAPAGFGRRHVAPLLPAFLDANGDVSISLDLLSPLVCAGDREQHFAQRLDQLALCLCGQRYWALTGQPQSQLPWLVSHRGPPER